jgi:hypothetical protein
MASFPAERDPLGRGSIEKRRRSMSTEENKDLVRRLFDAVNRRSLEELDTLLGPEFLLNGEPVGLDDFKEFVDWHVSVLTEVRFTIEDLIAEPSKLADPFAYYSIGRAPSAARIHFFVLLKQSLLSGSGPLFAEWQGSSVPMSLTSPLL